jgi:hypothetical protein
MNDMTPTIGQKIAASLFSGAFMSEAETATLIDKHLNDERLHSMVNTIGRANTLNQIITEMQAISNMTDEGVVLQMAENVARMAAKAIKGGEVNKVWCIFHTHKHGHDHYFHVGPTAPTLDEAIELFGIDYAYEMSGEDAVPCDDRCNLEIFEAQI